MTGHDDFRIRPGRIRSTRSPRTKPFLAQALQAAQKAGGLSRGRTKRGSTFGRGRAASLAASRLLNNRARGAIVKARVVRRMRSPGALRAHIGYLKRDGVTRDGSPGKLFNAAGDEVEVRDFASRCEGDRHHFRFIVSPDDAGELGSLRSFTRELMNQASRDLGTSSIGSQSIIGTPNTRMSTSSFAVAPMMAETSSSAATISRWACVPVPAISSPVSSVRDQSSRRASASKGK
jgi:hypothetical protein